MARRMAAHLDLAAMAAAVALLLCSLGGVVDPRAGLVAALLTLAAGLALRLRSVRRPVARTGGHWRHLAAHDPLTGLPNRASFLDRLDRSWGRSREVAVLYIDLDGFKEVNDTLGHAVGDALLVEAAYRMSSGLRERDVAARFGGDEFVAFLSDCGRSDALEVAERLRQALSEPYELVGRSVVVSASIGLCPPGAGSGPEDALRLADRALYRAKGEGRDRVVEFDDGLAQDSDRWSAAAVRMREALRTDGLRLVYQPEVDLVSGDVLSVEALLRLEGAEVGQMPLVRLIAAAEEHGLGRDMTAWVLDRALADVTEWRRLGWGGRVSVNVSGRLLAEGDLAVLVARALEAHGLAGDCLSLEFAESGLRGLREGSARTLDLLRDMGVTATLDDFGTGPSSLEMLRRFPWDCLKVEGSLLAPEPGGRAGSRGEGRTSSPGLAGPLSRLCHDLGHEVVAEGIETSAQLVEQRLAGVRRGQGYLLAAPLRPEDLRPVLAVGRVLLPA